MKKLILILTIYLISTINANAEFSFTFEWGDIKKCTSGNPNKVENPIFNLVNVPEGTKELRFKMKDGSMKMPAMSRTTAPKAAAGSKKAPAKKSGKK